MIGDIYLYENWLREVLFMKYPGSKPEHNYWEKNCTTLFWQQMKSFYQILNYFVMLSQDGHYWLLCISIEKPFWWNKNKIS